MNQNFNNDVSNIIKLQLANGSWNELLLIDKLAKNSQNVKLLVKELGEELVVTQLVVSWLQKYYSDKQYSLIIKKALSWIKKMIERKPIWEDKLKNMECI